MQGRGAQEGNKRRSKGGCKGDIGKQAAVQEPFHKCDKGGSHVRACARPHPDCEQARCRLGKGHWCACRIRKHKGAHDNVSGQGNKNRRDFLDTVIESRTAEIKSAILESMFPEVTKQPVKPKKEKARNPQEKPQQRGRDKRKR